MLRLRSILAQVSENIEVIIYLCPVSALRVEESSHFLLSLPSCQQDLHSTMSNRLRNLKYLRSTSAKQKVPHAQLSGEGYESIDAGAHAKTSLMWLA